MVCHRCDKEADLLLLSSDDNGNNVLLLTGQPTVGLSYTLKAVTSAPAAGYVPHMLPQPASHYSDMPLSYLWLRLLVLRPTETWGFWLGIDERCGALLVSPERMPPSSHPAARRPG